MIPPKRFDIFSPWLGDAQKVYVRSDFSLNKKQKFRAEAFGIYLF